MIKNYLRIAIRGIIRNKLYSAINIAGLALGMAACIAILFWVAGELNYDSFYKNLDRIFLIAQTQHYQGAKEFTISPTPMPLADLLEEGYPDVEHSARYEPWLGERILAHNEKSFNEQVNFADPSFFRIFTFDFVEGNPNTALTSPNSIVLTQETAHKLFGDVDPLGGVLKMGNRVSLKVTGIIRNIPRNSDIKFDGIVPTELMKSYGLNVSDWGGNMIMTYVLLRNPQEASELSQEIGGLLKRYYNPQTAGKLFLFPFKNYHLYSISGKGGRIEDVILFSIVAFVILVVACMNFINLATARSTRRVTEVGVRKAVGATRLQIAEQFLTESIVLTLISLGVAIALIELFLPYLHEVAGVTLKMAPIGLAPVLSILAVAIATSILAGIYPAIFVSSFKPISILKKRTSTIPGKLSVRRILVVFQFIISITLIICTSVIYLQLEYIFRKDIGLSPKNIVYFRLDSTLKSETGRLKDALEANSNILSATTSSNIPTFIYYNGGGWTWEGMQANQNALVSFTSADYDYLKTFDIGLSGGRFFSKSHPADDSSSIVINQSFAELIGHQFHIGMQLSWGENRVLKVIGVVKDFNFSSLRKKIGPLAIFYTPESQYMSVKINSAHMQGVLSFIRRTCSGIDPGFVFNYHFLDKSFEQMYLSEERLANILGTYTLLAMIIACLGLLGLSAYAAELKTKEIGIRKALGASVPHIVLYLSRELASLVVLANLIAWPVAYYFMHGWLRDFAYRVAINAWVFISAGALALLLALITTGFQAIKAAKANVVESLRYE